MKRNRGFTLMEMLIVVAIIAVLAAIAIPVFNGSLHKAKVAADMANVRAYYAELQTQLMLTGEADHHDALDAKRLGLSLIAAGHYATEFPVTAAVAAALRTALPELEVLVSTENRDPYTYL